MDASQFPLPDWAVAYNDDHEIKAGTQLCTKDGRRCGNAHVICQTHPTYANGTDLQESTFYFILTDAGTKLTLLTSEIEEMFHIGDYISDVRNVIQKFDRYGHFSGYING